MKIVGYPDKLTVAPGDEIRFMVSSDEDPFEADLVRLIHGDTNPAGPGFKCEPVDSTISGRHRGVPQRLRSGSYLRIPHDGGLDPKGSFTLHAWIRPTTPDKERQTLLSQVGADGVVYALRLEQGRPCLQVGADGSTVTLDESVREHTWYSIAAVYDADSGQARVSLQPLAATAAELAGTTSSTVPAPASTASRSVIIAGESIADGDDHLVGNFYNGKIECPRVFHRALDDDQVRALGTGDTPPADGLAAAWDFSLDISTRAITDVSGNGFHGTAVNKPMRAATGRNWQGTQTAWPHAPEQYGAIHFHDDDLDDAGWEPSIVWNVPKDTSSGVYAIHLRAGGEEDHVPFVVRPRRGTKGADIVLIWPTFSHLAYANEHLIASMGKEILLGLGLDGAALVEYPATAQDRYIVDNRLNSLYDRHTDGSGVCYSSRLRPLVNMRPKCNMAALNDGEGSPHQFNADLHLVDWLHEQGYTFDVVTDEDLHREGYDLLAPYRVALTGSHHEYWSLEMVLAAQRYLREGGRMMYLAGNGMYWVTQHDPELGNGIEIRRRGPSTRSWEPEPGEAHLAATGELGGLWKYRGHPPQSWLGVGFTAQGLGAGRPYARQPDSYDERAAWIFEGVDDELIGDFPSLVNGYGAAGFEVDRVDPALGTPHRTLLLASATGFSDSYQHVSEEVLVSDSSQGGSVNPLVRADMVLLEYPGGGAVFSPGSISWCACLYHDGYDNNVSRITRNVLDGFLAEADDR